MTAPTTTPPTYFRKGFGLKAEVEVNRVCLRAEQIKNAAHHQRRKQQPWDAAAQLRVGSEMAALVQPMIEHADVEAGG